MSAPIDPTLRSLSDCGCCEGLSAETPVAVENRPGLTAIAYRTGTHATFKETLLSRLSTSRQRALRPLTSRDDDDFSIALLDGWAAVCDLLSFYQERIANESYLPTATELTSAVELGRLIGYRLQPGVAASAELAFTLEEAPGALGQALGVATGNQGGAARRAVPAPSLRITIDAGTKVQSIPGPGETAQTFETTRAIEARADWNSIRPRLRQRQTLTTNVSSVMLEGAAVDLKRGDRLLLVVSASTFALRRVLGVTVDEDARTTKADIGGTAPFPPAFTRPTLPAGTVSLLASKTSMTGQLVQSAIVGRTWSEEDLAAVVRMQGWDVDLLAETVATEVAAALKAPGQHVFLLRHRAAIFGHNAPLYASLSGSLRTGSLANASKADVVFVAPAFPSSWENRTLADDAGSGKNFIFLDSVYPTATPGSYVVLVAPPSGGTKVEQVCRVLDSVETTRSDFSISAKVTRLTVEFVSPATPTLSSFPMRTTTVLLQGDELPLASIPVPNAVAGDTVVLDRMLPGLKVGQTVMVTGERVDPRSTVASEAMVLKKVLVEAGLTVVTFQKGLEHGYVRRTVTINGNVAPATHGETVQEVLGSGDASQRFQRFTLKQPPLTYVSAATPTGAISTLEVRVNGVLWQEVPALFGRGPTERLYVAQVDANGVATVMFGDGVTGARLPSGAENVRARYRKGIGSGGLVGANRITMLLSRPLGLKEASNPRATSGAADPENVNDVRRNAPLPIRTLGRIVSLQDYEDFARSFAGIAKSLATWTWSGNRRAVFVTVAGVNGAAVPPASDLYRHLLTGMLAAGDPTVPLTVVSYTPRFFRLAADIRVDPDFIRAAVTAAVEQRLRERFSFDAREFGQPVALSQVVAAIQSVRGVVAVDLNLLYRSDLTEALQTVVPAAAPQSGADAVSGAELLTLDARPIALQVLP